MFFPDASLLSGILGIVYRISYDKPPQAGRERGLFLPSFTPKPSGVPND